MNESWYIFCANCGKQVLVDGTPDEKCYLCGKSARKKVYIEKEVTMESTMNVPLRPSKRKKLDEYLEQNKEAIIGDYNSMPLREFFIKWHISTIKWGKLKKLWAVPSKGYMRKSTGRSKTVKEPIADDAQVVPLEEHERYLMLLGYQQAVREFLSAIKTRRE